MQGQDKDWKKRKEKKRGEVIYERGVKGRRDEHNGGAGRDSGQLITMALPWETVEDVTERNGGTQKRNTTWRRVKKRRKINTQK